MVKIPFIGGIKQKRFFVRLTGRGGKTHFIGEIKARDVNELIDIVMKRLEELGDAVKQYSHIRITDLERNQEIKIENPLYDGESGSQRTRSIRLEDFSSELLAQLLTTTGAMMTGALKLQSMIMMKVGEGIAEGVRGLVSGLLTMQNPATRTEGREFSLKDIAELGKFFMDVVHNWDKYNQVLKELFGKMELKGEGK